MPAMGETRTVEGFIARWYGIGANENATAQTFVIELCEVLDLPRPYPTPEQNYMFERPITFTHGDGSTAPGRIDCYRRGCFVLEAKKLKAQEDSIRFQEGMLRARSQAEEYARALSAAEGRPPFVLAVDIAQRIEVYAEFSRTGGTYTPFPDPRSHRIALPELRRPELQERLRLIWQEPDRLNPALVSAQVTRKVAATLAELARSMEESGHAPHTVAAFLSRCLFSMFAEDVELLPPGCFQALLQNHCQQPATLQHMLRALWQDMDRGGFSAALQGQVLHFNGKLFKESNADGYSLLLTPTQIALLIEAARANWREVEPAIFGTLLERALHPTERHSLGAHYTPRAYVERLVLPTVIEPLRAEWANAQASALLLAKEVSDKQAQAPQPMERAAFLALGPAGPAENQRYLEEEARHRAAVNALTREAHQQLHGFLQRLCSVRVLDPACGSGNFLYVTLEHLKRLEGEVLDQMLALGIPQAQMPGHERTVNLQQLLGMELNERAAALAELVLWIGYLQWQLRTGGSKSVAQPVVHDYGNIARQDAVLAYSGTEPLTNAAGAVLTRWDGTTTLPHPVTGQPVPDSRAQIAQWRYLNPQPATWPRADFIVGNPPFIGASTMRSALGDGYVDALRAAWPQVPDSADFVMYWWHHAAQQVRAGHTQRFGFITTNSLRQTFNRRVVQAAMGEQAASPALSLLYAIPDHPWVDNANGAAVRIAMTVAEKAAPAGPQQGPLEGRLQRVLAEQPGEFGEVAVDLSDERGVINADLTVGADVSRALPLRAMLGISSRGHELGSAGFIVTREEAGSLGLGTIPGLEAHIREYRNGRDLTAEPRDVLVIDLCGLTAAETRAKFPAVFQRLSERVQPERAINRDPKLRDQWWLHRGLRRDLRAMVAGLPRYIATVETAKHRVFQFLDASVLPDNMLIAIASDDALHLGVLSSRVHGTWALAMGGTLEDRPRYNKTRCFETYPLPSDDTGLTPALTQHIRQLAEQIDAHRKAQQAAHPAATLTACYNVLEKLRSGLLLTAKEKATNNLGLVGTLKSLHDELDAAVLQAYGWADLLQGLPHGPPTPAHHATLLQRLVDLNARRAQEEATGTVRWLRPSFQHPAAAQPSAPLPTQASLPVGPSVGAGTPNPGAEQRVVGPAAGKLQPWPTEATEQIKAVAHTLSQASAGLTVEELAAQFQSRTRTRNRLPNLLDTLQALGRARLVGGRWVYLGR